MGQDCILLYVARCLRSGVKQQLAFTLFLLRSLRLILSAIIKAEEHDRGGSACSRPPVPGDQARTTTIAIATVVAAGDTLILWQSAFVGIFICDNNDDKAANIDVMKS